MRYLSNAAKVYFKYCLLNFKAPLLIWFFPSHVDGSYSNKQFFHL